MFKPIFSCASIQSEPFSDYRLAKLSCQQPFSWGPQRQNGLLSLSIWRVFVFCFFRKITFYSPKTCMKFTLYPRLAFNSQQSSCLTLPSARITGVSLFMKGDDYKTSPESHGQGSTLTPHLAGSLTQLPCCPLKRPMGLMEQLFLCPGSSSVM